MGGVSQEIIEKYKYSVNNIKSSHKLLNYFKDYMSISDNA